LGLALDRLGLAWDLSRAGLLPTLPTMRPAWRGKYIFADNIYSPMAAKYSPPA